MAEHNRLVRRPNHVTEDVRLRRRRGTGCFKNSHWQQACSFVRMAVNVAIYASVSTDQQTTHPQKDELRAEAQSHGWAVMAEIEDFIRDAKFTPDG